MHLHKWWLKQTWTLDSARSNIQTFSQLAFIPPLPRRCDYPSSLQINKHGSCVTRLFVALSTTECTLLYTKAVRQWKEPLK